MLVVIAVELVQPKGFGRIRLRRNVGQAVEDLGIPAADAAVFDGMLKTELQHLEPYNCARYRLPIGKTQEWIEKGRPQ